MNSLAYWEKREKEALKNRITDEKQYEKELQKIYQNMLDSCQKEINAFYGKYAKREGITIAEAKKRVSKMDIAEYERKAKKYVKNKDFSDKANEEMRLYNATMKINRMEMLKANIGLELIKGHEELDEFMQGILQGRTEDELKRQAGILGKTVKNNAQTANAIVNASFHNATFSDRIWMHQDLLKSELSKLLQSGMIQGKNPRTLARELERVFGAKTADAERLMRTELARVQTEAQKQSFERNSFEQYTFHVNTGCCPICAGLNGKHFDVEKMQVGLNAPPMHPNCRCSTSAYEDSDEYEAWLDFLDNGGTTEEWNKQKAAQKAPLTKDELRQKIKEAQRDIFDIDMEVQEIEKNIGKHSIHDFDDLQGFTKKGINDKILHIDKRLAEIEPITKKYYNRPDRKTDEYKEWRKWRDSIDFMAIQEEQFKIIEEKMALQDKLRKFDKFEQWQSWKKEHPLEQLQADKLALIGKRKSYQEAIEGYKKQLSKMAIPSEWKRIQGSHTREDDLKATNPNYKTKKKEWTNNCQRCVSAYEARRRGYDVEAMPRILDGTDKLPFMGHKEGWTAVYEGIKPIKCASNRTANVKKKVEDNMLSFGDGARAIVRVQWQQKYGGGGHVFIAEQVDGKTIFIDPQSNEMDVSYYFSLAKVKETYVMRIDDLEFTDLIEKCCKGVE